MDHAIDHPSGPPTDQRDARLRALELLLSRQSSNMLQEPAPDGAELDLVLDAGLRAPDHGRLKPWRFVLIRGEQRLAWADRLAEAALARDPVNGQVLGERYRAWVWRTPLIIAVGAEEYDGRSTRWSGVCGSRALEAMSSRTTSPSSPVIRSVSSRMEAGSIP